VCLAGECTIIEMVNGNFKRFAQHVSMQTSVCVLSKADILGLFVT
jgi:hypothetical protein